MLVIVTPSPKRCKFNTAIITYIQDIVEDIKYVFVMTTKLGFIIGLGRSRGRF